jgi:hypothetical protein
LEKDMSRLPAISRFGCVSMTHATSIFAEPGQLERRSATENVAHHSIRALFCYGPQLDVLARAGGM